MLTPQCSGLCGPAFAKKSSLAIPHLKYARQDDDFDFGDSEGEDDSSVDPDDFDSGDSEDTSDSFGEDSDSTETDSSFDSGDTSLDDGSETDNDFGEGSEDDGAGEDGSFDSGDVDIDPSEGSAPATDTDGDQPPIDDGSLDGGLGEDGSAPVTDTDGDQPPIDDDGTGTIDDGTDTSDDGTGTIDDGTGTIDDGTDTVDDGTETTTDANPDTTSTAADASITDPASDDSEDEDSSTSSAVDADSTSSAAEAASTDDSEASSPTAASTSAAPAAAQTTAAAAQTTAAAAAPTSAADSLTCGGPSPNDATISLIKQFEGFVPSPAPDPIGLATVGFGHKCTSKSCAIAGFTFPLSQTTASQLLNNDLQQFVSCVNSAVSNSVTLTDNQLGALTSFAFNLGCGTLKSSTLLKRLNAGEDPNTVAAAEIPRFNKAGGKVLAGLVKRRAAEVALFQTASQVKAHPC
jgi:GH24 family phage-related lysozyme (muramidase)